MNITPSAYLLELEEELDYSPDKPTDKAAYKAWAADLNARIEAEEARILAGN